MKNLDEASLDRLIDWQRIILEDLKTPLFCPTCGQLVKLKLFEHKSFRISISAPIVVQ